MPIKVSRRLIWIPIIHSQADLGSLGEPIRRLRVRKVGQARWEEHVRSVERLWDDLGAELARLQLDYPHTRLYQDGLPICGREEEIVRDLAAAGSTNHQILLDLMARGCRLTGTESPELLLEEYNLTRTLLTGPRATGAARTARGQDPLQIVLERRDRFIAERIGQTLADGAAGLLFLGLLHAIEAYLPPDIAVDRLDPASQLVRINGPPRVRRAGLP